MLLKNRWDKKLIILLIVFCLIFSHCSVFAAGIINPPQGNIDEIKSNIDISVSVSSKTVQNVNEYVATMGEEGICFSIKLSAKDGYVKNPVLSIANLDDEIFEIDESKLNNEFIQSINGNEITISRLDGEALIEIPVKLKEGKYYNPNKINSDVEFVLKGIFVDLNSNHIEVSKSSSVKLGWHTYNEKFNITSSIEKSFSYISENKKYMLAQYEVGIELDEKAKIFPIERTKIDFEIPKNETLIPQTVIIDSESTSFTNGLMGNDVVFDKDNWKYEDGKVYIEVLNNKIEDEENKYIIPQGKDKYLITVIYLVSGNNLQVESDVKALIRFYNNGTTKEIDNEGRLKYDLSKNSGSLVSYNVEKTEAEISKGNIYANYNLSSNYYDTEYTNMVNVNISKADLVKSVQIQEKEEYFEDRDNKKYETFNNGVNNSYYKCISFKKENLDNILGEKGSISLYTIEGKKLITIDKNVQADEDGNIVVKFNSKIGKILIKVDNPEKEGILSISNTKEIEKLNYSKNVAMKFKKLVTKYKAFAKYDTKISDELGEVKEEVKLKETKTSATVSLGKKTLSTLNENKDVQLKIALNNYNETTDLYRNPTFEVTFPKEIKEIKVKNMNILCGNNEFSISNVETYKNKKGNIVIRISVKGIQTKYSLVEATDGTNIIFDLNIKLDLYTASKKGKILMNYYNECATNYSNPVPWAMDKEKNDNVILNANGLSDEEISFIAPAGVVSAQRLSNYNEKNNVYSINQGVKTDRILTNSDKKVVDSEIIIMNNSESDMKNVSILGRTAFIGNRSISSNEDLGTNIDTKFIQKISELYGVYKNAKIYYSSNPDATKDINDKSNSWTTDYKSISNIKSYLIVIDEGLKIGEILVFSYDFEIPEKLGCDRKLYTTFNTYYSKENGEMASKESDVVGLETVTTPKITAKVTSNAGDIVTEGQIIEYTVKVKNEGEEPAENINYSFDIPENTVYVKYIPSTETRKEYYKKEENVKQININIGNIEPKEEKLYTYLVEVNENAEKISAAKVKATAEGLNGEKVTDEEVPKVEDTTEESKVDSPDVILKFGQDAEGKIVRENDGLKYYVSIRNNTDVSMGIGDVKPDDGSTLNPEENKNKINDLKGKKGKELTNVLVEQVIPEEVTFDRAYILKDNNEIEVGKYDEKTRIYRLTIDEIEAGDTYSLTITCKTNYLGKDIKKDISSYVTVSGEGFEKLISKNVHTTIARPNIETTFKSTATNKYVKENEKITYTITAKNTGILSARNFNVTYTLPKELKGISGTYYLASDPSNVNNIYVVTTGKARVTVNLEANDTLIIKVVAKVKEIDKNEKEIKNYAIIEYNNLQKQIKTDTVTNILQKVEKKETNNVKKEKFPLVEMEKRSSYKKSETKKYKITGKSWLDSNKNGKRDEKEKGINNITVKLYNASTNKIVQTEKTNKSGDYVFSNLSVGKYYIVFSYDTSRYDLTKYQKKGVDNSLNSDVIKTNSLAITDVITISNTNIGNIDIGLLNASKFDMSLKKTISKITVYSNKGQRVYKYNNASFGKIDIKAKELSNSKVYMEYNIVVKNNGEVSGYVKNVVDYMPKGTVFMADLNSGWYKNTDGNIYNTKLKNTEIKPGESKTVSIILVKQMTEKNTGIVSNSAEIAELYNEYGIEDIDSKVANRAENEDDFGTADIVISVNTGGLLINAVVIIICISLSLIFVYVFKKVVLDRIRRW